MCQNNKDSYAFGPVVKELEELSCFKKIVWIGFNNGDINVNKSLVKLKKGNIKLILLPSSGGNSLWSKLYILLLYPIYIFVIFKELVNSKYIHVRAPSNPAVITMLLSMCFPSKRYWFKYAGNWIGTASRFYKFQRQLLKKLTKSSKVTVNGNWANQPGHVLGFENPCLDETDRELGQNISIEKQLEDTINYCFVGGMNTNKGVDLIVKILPEIVNHENFGKFHFVGGGELLQVLKMQTESFTDKIIFHDFLAKQDIYKIYKKCHFIVLPSKSEGFPKVIGEAMNFGCIPIVSDVSCIGQYIKNNENGLLIEPLTTSVLLTSLNQSLEMPKSVFKNIVLRNYNQASKFTYSYYQQRITNNIFN
jgi:glycosyltransferase involved in cell wall biosynthesis